MATGQLHRSAPAPSNRHDGAPTTPPSAQMHPVQRRALLNRSQTASGGPVPLDGDSRVNRSHSASSGSLGIASLTSSTNTIPNLICVEPKSDSSSLSGACIDDYREPIVGQKPSSNGNFFKVLEYLHMADGPLDAAALCTDAIRCVVVCGEHSGQQMLATRSPSHTHTKVITKTVHGQPKRSSSCDCLDIHDVVEVLFDVDVNSTAQELLGHFDEVNRVIAEARARAAHVAILDMQSKAGATFAVQHIMSYYEMDVERAMQHWHKMADNDDQLPDNCMQSLLLWQKILEKGPTSPTGRREVFASTRPMSVDATTSMASSRHRRLFSWK